MLPGFALCSLADLKEEIPVGGTTKDAQLEKVIVRVSRAILQTGLRGRAIVFQPPIEDASRIVASVLLANGALTLAAQPAGARTIVVSITDADRSLTAGTLTITGTVAGVAGVTETFDLAQGVDELHGGKFFTAISGAVVSGLVGNGAGDLIRVGTSKGYVEYYSPSICRAELFSRDWPIVNIAELNEDSDRAYAAATQLVEGTAFIVDRESGTLRRIDGYWQHGPRSIRNTHSAGAIGLANVPADVRDVALQASSRLWQNRTRHRGGKDAETNALGSVTINAERLLTSAEREQLAEWAARPYGPRPEREAA